MINIISVIIRIIMITSRRNDERAVSPLVGAVLLFAIAVLMLGLFQANLVPSICKSQEAANAASVTKTLENLVSELNEGKQASVTLDTVHYRKYPFLVFPPSPPMIIRIEPYYVNFSYSATLPNGSVVHRSFTVKNSRLIVEMQYFYYPPTKFVYENSALFEIVNNHTVVLIPPAVNNNSLKLVVINKKNISVATNTPYSLNFNSVSEGEFYAKNITVTFKSVCPDAWKKYAEVSGNTVLLKASNVNVYVYRYENRKAENFTLIPLNSNYTVTVNQSVTLGVKAVDDLFAGVPGITVNVSVVGGEVTENHLVTDGNGIATTTFFAKSPGTAEVVFNASGRIVRYTIVVKKLPSFYTTVWLDKSEYDGKTIVGVRYSTIKLYVKVTKDGQPVSNALVYFGVNNSSVAYITGNVYVKKPMMMVGYENYSYTNSSGIATAELQLLENGSVAVYCYSGGSGDVLNLNVVVVGGMGGMM